MKPSEVLDAAAKLIEPEGAWTQGAFARTAKGRKIGPGTPGASCWCASGALVRTGGPYGRAINCFEAVTDGESIVAFNDAPNRTQAQAVSALRQAADLARKAGE